MSSELYDKFAEMNRIDQPYLSPSRKLLTEQKQFDER